jgi:ABC-type sugar transport system permease subunit
VLGLLFLLPAAALLLVFLTYPLGLGIWLGFTDTKIGRAGHWVGLANYLYLAERRGRAAVGVQHDRLHGRRERRSSSRWACGWHCC